MTRRDVTKWVVFGLVLIGIGIGSAVKMSQEVYSRRTARDFRLTAALDIAVDDARRKGEEAKICASPSIRQAASQLKTKELATLVDFWLKLRNAAEQRADWYYVALIAAFAALMSGYEKLRQEPVVACTLLGALGFGAGFAGFWIGNAGLYDVGRINLIGQILECSPASERLGVTNGQYVMDRGFAEGPFSAGILFAALMVLFGLRLLIKGSEPQSTQGSNILSESHHGPAELG